MKFFDGSSNDRRLIDNCYYRLYKQCENAIKSMECFNKDVSENRAYQDAIVKMRMAYDALLSDGIDVKSKDCGDVSFKP